MKIILVLLIILLLTVNVFSYYLIKEPDALIKLRCLKDYKTQGDSMLPNIINGDKVTVDICFNYNDLNLEDIIVYKEKDNLIGHRIKYISETTFKTKGDNNEFPDSLKNKEYYVGKIIMEKGK